MDRIVAFIPARGGSKSIPLKNIKEIAGKPLIFWTIEAALNCPKIDRVYLSTDSPDIINCAKEIKNRKLQIVGRSAETATDTASTESVMLEFANNYDFQHIVLIQATSPLLKTENLNEGIEKFFANKADSLLSVVRQKRFIWEDDENGAKPVNYDYAKRPRRQEFDGFFVENGAFYITAKTSLLNSKNRLSGKIELYEMDEKAYFEIDEPSDWVIVEKFLKHQNISKQKNDIKLFLTDVDGVLTDAGMYYAEDGNELKKFNTTDGKGFELLRKVGIKTGIITSENTKIVERRGKKLKLDYVFQGILQKLDIATQLCKELNISLNEVAYIGDDLNDIDLLEKVGLAACPANATTKVKQIEGIVQLKKSGGNGAVREFIEMITDGKY